MIKSSISDFTLVWVLVLQLVVPLTICQDEMISHGCMLSVTFVLVTIINMVLKITNLIHIIQQTVEIQTEWVVLHLTQLMVETIIVSAKWMKSNTNSHIPRSQALQTQPNHQLHKIRGRPRM